MKKKAALQIIGGILILGGVFLFAQKVEAQEAALYATSTADILPAPIIISPNEQSVIGTPKPKIIGLAKSGAEVVVYIDNKYNGQTGVLTHPSGTANFTYTPFLNLEAGWHEAEVFIQDEKGHKSLSKFSRFKVEEYYPAPILYKPVVNSSTTPDKPLIVGLAKNDSRIQIFIDKVLYGEFAVQNHPSGTANFAYQPFLSLGPGDHLVYAVAIDSRGKKSPWSNLMSLKVRIPQISAETSERVVGRINGREQEVKPIIDLEKDSLNPNEKIAATSTYFKKIQATSTEPNINIKRIVFLIIVIL